MNNPSKRVVEVRLIVIVTIDLADPELAEALKSRHRRFSSVAQVVAQEVASNLESVSYVDAATVCQL